MPLVCVFPRVESSTDEIKAWIKRIDINGDGVLSKAELEAGLRGLHLWFAHHKSQTTMKKNDHNHSGAIDTPEEFKELEKYLKSRWGYIIHAD